MLVFFRSKVAESYGYKNYKNTRFRGESLIHLIWMFPSRIPSHEDIEENFEAIENTMGAHFPNGLPLDPSFHGSYHERKVGFSLSF